MRTIAACFGCNENIIKPHIELCSYAASAIDHKPGWETFLSVRGVSASEQGGHTRVEVGTRHALLSMHSARGLLMPTVNIDANGYAIVTQLHFSKVMKCTAVSDDGIFLAGGT